MKRKLIIALMLWICFILQTTVFSTFRFLSATPNLMMILTVSIGFMQHNVTGFNYVGIGIGNSNSYLTIFNFLQLIRRTC